MLTNASDRENEIFKPGLRRRTVEALPHVHVPIAVEIVEDKRTKPLSLLLKEDRPERFVERDRSRPAGLCALQPDDAMRHIDHVPCQTEDFAFSHS